MRIRNGDIELHVDEDGDPGAPPVLLLHGITSSGRTWDWLVPTLAATHRVLRLDFHGHGRSDHAPGSYDMAHYVSDAVAVCEQVAKRPCIVVGHSLGGATAAALAQRRRDLVAAVVLEDAPLFLREGLGDNSLMGAFQLMRQSVPMLQEQKVSAEAIVAMLTGAPSATGAPFGELVHGDALEAMAAGLMQLDATVLDPVLEGRVVTAFDQEMPIPVPVLALAADSSSPDAVMRTADIERLAITTPDAEVRVVSGAGHLIHDELTHREVVRDAIRSFVDAHS